MKDLFHFSIFSLLINYIYQVHTYYEIMGGSQSNQMVHFPHHGNNTPAPAPLLQEPVAEQLMQQLTESIREILQQNIGENHNEVAHEDVVIGTKSQQQHWNTEEQDQQALTSYLRSVQN